MGWSQAQSETQIGGLLRGIVHFKSHIPLQTFAENWSASTCPADLFLFGWANLAWLGGGSTLGRTISRGQFLKALALACILSLAFIHGSFAGAFAFAAIEAKAFDLYRFHHLLLS